MLATRLTLTAVLGLALFGCGKEDRTAPPRVPPTSAGRDGGPSAGSGGSRPDGGAPEDGGGPTGCLKSGGAGSVTTLEGERVVGTVEGAFTVETLERTTDGATTTLALEIFGGDVDIDAGGGSESYRVDLIMTALPGDQVRIGDVLGITWNTNDSAVGSADTLIVTRDEALLFFSVHSGPGLEGDSLVPALEPFGIAIGTGAESCEFSAETCKFREHALRVTSGDEEATVSPSGLARVGDLTVAGRVLELLPSAPNCESSPTTVLASGFMKRK